MNGDDIAASPIDDATAATGGRNRLIAVGLASLIVIAGAVFALTRLTDQDNSALTAVPKDAHIVVTTDLQLADSDRVDALISTFARPMADAGYIDDAQIDIVDRITTELENELGIDLGEDALSWVGRSAAVALWIPADMLEFDSQQEPDGAVVLSVTDRSRADAFLRSLEGFVEATPLEDGESYRFSDMDDGLAWLGDDLLVFANEEGTLLRSLSARDGESILDDETFDDVLSRLPGDRLLAGYISGEFFDAIAEATASLAGPPSEVPGLGDVLAFGFSASLPDVGLRLDAVQVMADDATLPVATGEVEILEALPADTIGFLAGLIPEGSVTDGVAGLRNVDPAAYDEIVTQLSIDLGVDIEGELLPSIAGETVLVVVPDTSGVLAVEAGVDIGILLSLGLVDPGPMGAFVAAIEQMLTEAMGLAIVQGTPVQVIGGDQVIAAYQVGEDAFVLGSSSEVVSGFVPGDGGLTATDLYRDLDGELPGAGLALYVDMVAVFDLIDMSPADRAIADPVRGMGASLVVNDNTLTSSFVILVDYLP